MEYLIIILPRYITMVVEGLVVYVVLAIDLSFRAYTFKDVYIAIWIYIHITVVMVMFINLLLYLTNVNSIRLRSVLGKAVALEIIFINLVNTSAVFFIINDRLNANISLSRYDFVECIGFESLSFIYHGTALCILIQKLRRRRVRLITTKRQKEFIESLYQPQNRGHRRVVNNTIISHKELLRTFPLTIKEKNLIFDLFTVKVNGSNDKVCGICLCDLEDSQYETAISCSHSFHYECITDWYMVRPYCPFCKREFREPLIRAYLDLNTY